MEYKEYSFGKNKYETKEREKGKKQEKQEEELVSEVVLVDVPILNCANLVSREVMGPSEVGRPQPRSFGKGQRIAGAAHATLAPILPSPPARAWSGRRAESAASAVGR